MIDTTQPTYPAQAAYAIQPGAAVKCRNCQQDVIWQLSFATKKNYLTEVKMQNGQQVTARNWFHNCTRPAPQQLQLLEPPAEDPPTTATYQPQGTGKAAKQRAMKQFIEQAKEEQLRAALLVIFRRQTNQEKAAGVTVEHNGVGFGGSDAEILTDIAKQAQKYNGLRGGQIPLVRRKMRKYARQLVAALEGKEWAI